MPHLSNFERMRIVDLYNKLPKSTKSKFEVVAGLAFNQYQIKICDKSVRNIVKKWEKSCSVGDKPRPNKDKLLISNTGILNINNALLNDPCLTAGKIKKRLFLTASQQTIRRCIRKLGWRKIQTKYCQIVSPINRIKRFVYASMAKKNNENFYDVIDLDECTVEVRKFSAKNWHKTSNNKLLRAWGGKLGKPKHNFKLHLFGGISRRGLTPLVIFTGIMHENDYQNFLIMAK